MVARNSETKTLKLRACSLVLINVTVLRLRYEDVSTQPLEYAEKIYRFVGLHMTEYMKNWIINSTKVKFWI